MEGPQIYGWRVGTARQVGWGKQLGSWDSLQTGKGCGQRPLLERLPDYWWLAVGEVG